MLREQTNSGIEQCNIVKKDEYRVCSIEDENSVISNDKSNTDKKANFKESSK